MSSVGRPSQGPPRCTWRYQRFAGQRHRAWQRLPLGEWLGDDATPIYRTTLSFNGAPEFPADRAQRRVSPSAQPGENIGASVTATDIDGDVLTYRLSGSTLFEIEPHTGQITVAAGVVPDPVAQPEHAVTVVATDRNAEATIVVAITVTTGPVGPSIIGGGSGGGPSGPSPSDIDFEWTVKTAKATTDDLIPPGFVMKSRDIRR